VVIAVVTAIEERGIAVDECRVGFDLGDGCEGVRRGLGEGTDGLELEIGDAPVEASAEETEGVAFGGERDGAVAVGALFAVNTQANLGGGGVVDPVAECVACGLTKE